MLQSGRMHLDDYLIFFLVVTALSYGQKMNYYGYLAKVNAQTYGWAAVRSRAVCGGNTKIARIVGKNMQLIRK